MQATSFAARLAHHHTTIPSFDPLVSINPFLPSTTTSTMYPTVRTSHSHQIHLAKQTPARISSRSRCCFCCCCRRKLASHPAIQPPSRNDVQTRLCRALIPPPLPCAFLPQSLLEHMCCDVMCCASGRPSLPRRGILGVRVGFLCFSAAGRLLSPFFLWVWLGFRSPRLAVSCVPLPFAFAFTFS